MTNEKQGRFPVPFIIGALTVFVAMASVVLAKEFLNMDSGMAKRLVGITIGVMLVIAGNYFPKFGVFRAFSKGNLHRAAAAELMTGRILCLAGVVFVGIWAFATISKAPLGAALIGLAAFFLALASFISLRPGKNIAIGTISEDTAESRQKSALRSAILHILHAIAWVCIMLLADTIWGDQARLWTVVGFIVSSGFLTVILQAFSKRLS